jgi:hypothetical protein
VLIGSEQKIMEAYYALSNKGQFEAGNDPMGELIEARELMQCRLGFRGRFKATLAVLLESTYNPCLD